MKKETTSWECVYTVVLCWAIALGGWGRATLAYADNHPRTGDNKYEIPWLVETTPAGNMLGAFIPNQEGYVTMICESTKVEWDRTHSISCHSAIPFPVPQGLPIEYEGDGYPK
jgi:hypothetical protein